MDEPISTQQHIICLLEDYCDQPPESRDAHAMADQILAASKDCPDKGLFSPLGFALRASADFAVPEVISALCEKVTDKEQRIDLLYIFSNHFSPSMCTPAVLEAVFGSLSDVINEPLPGGRTAIFQGMHAAR